MGCAPELGETPFLCTSGGECPSGYTCRSTVCAREGAPAGPARAERVGWINASELHWLPRPGGGAVLVMNDGFTSDARGIYDIQVTADGAVGAPRPRLLYGDELAMSSKAVVLDDGRFAVVRLRYPRVSEDNTTLELFAFPWEPTEEPTQGIETLYQEQEPYLGSTEPTSLGAVANAGAIDIAWARPSAGGRVEVMRVEQQNGSWKKTRSAAPLLPKQVIPLLGDCALWDSGAGERVLRVGYKTFAVAKLSATGTLSPFTIAKGVPLYGFGDTQLLLRYGDRDPTAATYPVSYALASLSGTEPPSWDLGGVLQENTVPYSATAFQGGALFAPLSDDPAFPALEVGWRSPSQGLTRLASIARTSRQKIYTARAFARDGKVYVAWTEFGDNLMDLWIGTADIQTPGGQQ